ncbi:hypothetical protein M0R45_028574 [Rubus argutus]|uniref:Uncharacterized protein n=1 Tax=Rubus argutus TaxID=59490 RepID=A0AAW1W6E0_RUBAR
MRLLRERDSPEPRENSERGIQISGNALVAVRVSIPIVDGVDPAESDEVDAGAEPVVGGGRRRLVSGHGVRIGSLGLDALLLLRFLRLHRLTFSRARSVAEIGVQLPAISRGGESDESQKC